MRKLAIALTVVMILALATPAFAAGLTLNGKITGTVTYERPHGAASGNVKGNIKLELTHRISGIPNGVSIKIEGGTAALTRQFTGDDQDSLSLFPALTIKGITITIPGQFRQGGQELTTVIGNYTDVDGKGRKGYSITGIKLADAVSARINWFPNTTIVRLDKSGKELSGWLDVRSVSGEDEMVYKGSVTVRPTDKMDVTATVSNSGKNYEFSTNVQATDKVKLSGKINQDKNYDVSATLSGLSDVPFNPTLKVGYEKVGEDTGVYTQADAVIEKLNVQARYNDRTEALKFFAGTGDIYTWAAVNNKTPDPFADIRTGATNEAKNNAGREGYVLIYDQTKTTKDMQIHARKNLKDFIDFGANTSVIARASLKNNVKTGQMTENLVGLIVSTKVSFAGFNNITIDTSVSSNLKQDGNVYGITAKYTAPNQIAFTASYKNKCDAAPWTGFNGVFKVEAVRSISF